MSRGMCRSIAHHRLFSSGHVDVWLAPEGWFASPLLACGTLGISPGNLSSSSCLGPFALGDHFAIAPSSSSACAPPFLAHLVFCALPSSTSLSSSSSSFAWCPALWATLSCNASPPPPHGAPHVEVASCLCPGLAPPPFLHEVQFWGDRLAEN